MWILLSGSIEIYEYEKIGENSKLKETKIILPINEFGELGLLEKAKRSATVICKEDCEFAILERVHYKEVESI